MRKFISLMLALLLVVSASFAGDYDEPGKTAGELLKKYQFVFGNEKGDLREQDPLTRAQLATLIARVYGVDKEAQSYTAPSGYRDEATFGWAKGYISYAKMKGWMLGSDNKFNPLGRVTGEELSAVMLRVLNREEKWGTNIGRMGAINVFIPNTELTRGQTFEALWKVVSEPIMKDGGILGVKLGKLDPKKKTPEKLEIASIEVTSLKEIRVKFNQEIEVPDVKNFEIVGASVEGRYFPNAVDSSVVAVFLAKPMTSQKEYTLKVKDIKPIDSSSQPLASAERKFVALDTTLPEVKSLTFKSPRSIEITFTEPYDLLGTVEIKQGNTRVSIDTSKTEQYSHSVVVHAFNDFVEGSEYAVTVKDFKDHAGFPNKIETKMITFTKDNAPLVVKVERASSSEVLVTFSRLVKGVTAKHFAHSFPNYHPILIKRENGKSYDSGTYESRFIVKFYHDGRNPNERPLPAGNVKFMIKGTADGKTIVDKWGNTLADTNIDVVVAEDQDPLTYTIKHEEAGYGFEMHFNKPMTLDTVGNIHIYNPKGSLMWDRAGHRGDPKAYYFTSNRPIYPGTYKFVIFNLKDTTPNPQEIRDRVEYYTLPDLIKPVLERATVDPIKEGGKEVGCYLVFDFKEADLSNEALDGKFYKFTDGKKYYDLTGKTGEFLPGNKSVRFRYDLNELPHDVYFDVLKNWGVSSVLVGDLTDTSGNKMETTSKPIDSDFWATISASLVKTHESYEGGRVRKGVKVIFSRDIHQLYDISGITTNYSGLSSFDSAEYKDNELYLYTSVALPEGGGFQVNIPAGVVAGDNGKTNPAVGHGVTDGIAPVPGLNSDESLRFEYISGDTFRMYLTQEIDRHVFVEDNLESDAVRVKVISGGVTRDLVPTRDFKCTFASHDDDEFDIVIPNLKTGDIVLIEWVGSIGLYDEEENSSPAMPGFTGKAVKP